MPITKFKQQLDLAPKGEALRTIVEAIKSYDPTTVTVLSGQEGVTHVAAVVGLPETATLYAVSGTPQKWWAQALGELGRRFRPVTKLPNCDVLVWDVRRGRIDWTLVSPTVQSAVVVVGLERFNKENIVDGVREFLRTHPAWVVVKYAADGVGVMVVSRDPKDKTPVKHNLSDAFGFFKAELSRRLRDGGTYLPLEMAKPRIDACLVCPSRGGAEGNTCKICKCFLFQIPEGKSPLSGKPGKVFFPGQACPIGSWKEAPEGSGVKMSADETGDVLRTAFSPPPPPTPPEGTS